MFLQLTIGKLQKCSIFVYNNLDTKMSVVCNHHFHAGIVITLARSPMVTRFCFGWVENSENYFFFARIMSKEFDPNLYFKKVSCLLLVEVVFWFCCDVWGKWYLNRRSSFGIKRWHGMRDSKIKIKSSVCLLLHTHTWGRCSRHTLQLVIGVLLHKWKNKINKLVVFYFSTRIYPCIIVWYVLLPLKFHLKNKRVY